jgi:tRNA(His) 5'-end guanylyltransferase
MYSKKPYPKEDKHKYEDIEKALAKKFDQLVNSAHIVRMDGKGFKTYFADFRQPYDCRGM